MCGWLNSESGGYEPKQPESNIINFQEGLFFQTVPCRARNFTLIFRLRPTLKHDSHRIYHKHVNHIIYVIRICPIPNIILHGCLLSIKKKSELTLEILQECFPTLKLTKMPFNLKKLLKMPVIGQFKLLSIFVKIFI